MGIDWYGIILLLFESISYIEFTTQLKYMINKYLYQFYYIYNRIGKILAKKIRLAILTAKLGHLLKSNRPALERHIAHDWLLVVVVVVVSANQIFKMPAFF